MNNDRNEIIRVKHVNWSMCGPTSWSNTTWIFYDNNTFEYCESFVPCESLTFAERNIQVGTISDEDLTKLKQLFEVASKVEDEKIDGCDGAAWSFEYQGVWKRELGYTYGKKEYEDIQNFLEHFLDNQEHLFL